MPSATSSATTSDRARRLSLDVDNLSVLDALATSHDTPLEDLRRLASACGLSTAIGGRNRRTKHSMVVEVIEVLSTAELATSSTIAQLREFIDERQLPVSKATGGRAKRTKDEVFSDIVRHLAMATRAIPVAVPVDDTTDIATPIRASPLAVMGSSSPLSVSDLELLLSPGSSTCNITDLKELCHKQALATKCYTGTKSGRTKADVAVEIISELSERGVPAGSGDGELAALRDLVVRHELPVSKGTGGVGRRTNSDIVSDILQYAATPEFKAQMVNNYTNGYAPTKAKAISKANPEGHSETETAATTTPTRTPKIATNARARNLEPVRKHLFSASEQEAEEEEEAELPVSADDEGREEGHAEHREGRRRRRRQVERRAQQEAGADPAASPAASPAEEAGPLPVLLLILFACCYGFIQCIGDLNLVVSDAWQGLPAIPSIPWDEIGATIGGLVRFLIDSLDDVRLVILGLDVHAPAFELALPGGALLALDQGTVLVLLVAAASWLALLVASVAQRPDRLEAASVNGDLSDGSATFVEQPAMQAAAASAPPAPASW